MRTRSAHLGQIIVEGERYWVTFKDGWITFRPFRKKSYAKVRAMALQDAFNIAEVQKTFAFVPKA